MDINVEPIDGCTKRFKIVDQYGFQCKEKSTVGDVVYSNSNQKLTIRWKGTTSYTDIPNIKGDEELSRILKIIL